MKNSRSASFWLYVLGAYILFQFLWWAWLLIDQTTEIDQLQQSIEHSAQILQNNGYLPRRVLMILGEGAVFIILLLFGFFKVKKALNKELELAHKQRNFLLSVTHELNTPIAGIKLLLQTMEKRELEAPKRKDLLNKALSETERLRELIQNILTTARLEEGQFQMLKKENNLSEFISSELENVKPLLQKRPLNVSIQEGIQCSFDESAVRSIFLNLLENAEKYSPDDSEIEISLAADKNSICLSIADLGPGIEKEHLKEIYSKFYRVEDERIRKNKGTGLGLYIVKNLLDLHEGKIEFEKNRPNGSRFKVYL